MPAMIILEETGPEGERLAMSAGQAIDVPVGFDSESRSATFDSDSHDEAELQDAVFTALGELDEDWRSHLSLVE